MIRFDKLTVKARYFSEKRWRSATLSGGKKIILQGIGADNRFNGELKEVYSWWFFLWYIEIKPVPAAVFTSRRLKGIKNER